MKHTLTVVVAFVFSAGALSTNAFADKKVKDPKAKPKAAPAAKPVKHHAPPPPPPPARPKTPEWKPFRDALGKATLNEVKRAAMASQTDINGASTFDLAVALYVFWQEGGIVSREGKTFWTHIERRNVSRRMHKENTRTRTGAEVVRYAKFLQSRYAMPCEGEKERANPNHLPPIYKCKGAPKDTPLSRAPEQIVPISSFTVVKRPPDEMDDSKGKDRPNEKLKQERLDWISRTTRELIPAEKRGVPKPKVFWANNKQFATYIGVARELYGRRHVSERKDDMPIVFCSPKRTGRRGASKSVNDEWSRDEVVCSSDWLKTVGKDIADSAEWACVGSNEFLGSFVLPGAGEAGDDNGFRCRRRIFQVIQPVNELSEKAEDEMIDKMCTMMRRQTWGDNIAQRVADKEAAASGKKPEKLKDPPRWPLTREEFLYFYGHTNKYCRANRKLTHRIDNEKWADDVTFTCGVPRGIVESGPFEEGVQVCATTPYVDRAFPEIRGAMRDANKGRLHCWKFDRPWCKEIAKGDTKKRMWISDVFDHYDIVGELRRTRDPDVLGMPDMKKITELKTFEVRQGLNFADAAKDGGVGSVKEFCRFHGSGKRVVCGYDQKSMAQYYELREHEAPEGCHDGICARGHYDRGYMCAVHKSPDIFGNKRLVWICGYDKGYFGTARLKAAEWVCVGGKWLQEYVDPDGSRTTLRCGRRAFRFAETLGVNDIVEKFDPLEGVRDWVKDHKLERKKVNVTRMWKDEHGAEYKQMHGLHKALGAMGAPIQKVVDNHTVSVSAEKAFYNIRGESRMRHLLDSKDGHWDKVLDHKMKALFDTLDDLRIDQAGFLGHRLTIRNYYLAARDKHFPKLQHFKEEFPRLRALLEEGLHQILASRDEKTKAIRGLIHDVLDNKRAPDGQWFQEVRNALADEKHDLVMREDIPGGRPALISAFLHYAMFNMLDHTRALMLRRAREYFGALQKHAGDSPALSRYELLDMARVSPLAPKFHGPLFCVERLGTMPRRFDKVQKKKVTEFAPMGEFICGTSPLLLAGAVEVFADKRFKDYEDRYKAAVRHGRGAKDWALAKNEKEELRLEAKNSVGGVWCYGATPGETPKVDDASRALEPGAGSPWVVDVPKREKDDRRDGWLRCEKYQFSDEAWFLALLSGEKEAERDEAGGGEGGGEAGQAMSLVGDGVESTMGKLGDIAKIIADLGGPDLTMIKKYVDQAMEIVKAVADAAKGNMGKVNELARKAEEAVSKFIADEANARVQAATTPGDATTKTVTEVKEKLAEAKAKFKEAQGKVESTFSELKKGAQKLKGGGGIVTALANELIDFLSKKIISFVEPFARKLINLVMNLLQPMVVALRTAIAGALAGIPFGGGALVMAVNAAFDYVWSAIVDLLTNKLMGVVERLLTAGLRAVFGPVVKAVKKMVVEGIQSLCQGMGISDFCPSDFAELPPKDRWLEGALACGEGVPVVPSRAELNAIASVARERLERRHHRLVEEAPQIARRFADRHFARYGHTLDSWMAMVGPAATAGQRAIAERLGREMEREVRAALAMKRGIMHLQ